MNESILSYRGRRYLWLSLLLALSAIAIYWYDAPQEPANGGTMLGYALGSVATFLVLLLTAFGVRKRRYRSTAGTVQGWLSAHVYLGLALIVIATLHSGFQFGVNVHTLAYLLMITVIASGFYGMTVYMKYPARLSESREAGNRHELFEELEDIDRRSKRIASGLAPEFAELIVSGISRTQLGSTLWARLCGRDESKVVLPGSNDVAIVDNAGQEASLDWLADQQSRCPDADTAATMGELSALVRNKRRLLRQLGEDLKIQARLELWLYAHVPLTAALLAALLTHILSVFVYW